MSQYEITIESAETSETIERNYSDLMISLITASISEVEKNEKSNNLFEGINGGTS